MNGKIIRLVRDRGFGFIRVEGGQEVFFHHTAVLDGGFDSMTEGGLVDFDMGQDNNSNRERAVNVRPLASESAETVDSPETADAPETVDAQPPAVAD